MEKFTKEMLDHEWVELIIRGKQMGLTIEEIQFFLKDSAKKENKGSLSKDLTESTTV